MSSTGQEKKSKEFRLEPKVVIPIESLLSSERIIKLLYTLEAYGEISEKGIYRLVYELKQRGLDLGYAFFRIGESFSSKQLREDITGLLYLELLETKGRAKKLVLTSRGREELRGRAHNLPEDFREKATKYVEELRGMIASIDAETEFKQISRR